MKIIIISFFLISVATSHSFAQNNYIMYNYFKAMAIYQTNPDSSDIYNEKALSFIQKPFVSDYFYLLRKYAKAGNREKVIETYKYILRKGYKHTEILHSDNRIPEQLVDELKKIQEPVDINIEFIVEFSEYIGAEQFIRKNHRRDTCLTKYMFQIDSLNHIRLKKYIDKNGFPGEFQLGKYSYIPRLLIAHIITNESTKESWADYYRPLLMKSANEGNVSYSLVSYLDDRFNWRYNNYQLYGELSMVTDNSEDLSWKERPKIISPPIEDIENLDKRRAQMGMPPFYIKAEKYNIKYPEGYNPKK